VRLKSTGPGLRGRAAGVFAVVWRPLLLWVIPAAALIGLCAGGLYLCRVHVETSPAYRVVAPKLPSPDRWPRPVWWEKKFEQDINATAAFADGASVLDDELLRKVAAAYGRCPWVRRVKSVQKRFPNRIEVAFDLRRPGAVVAVPTHRTHLGYILVGADGVRLPRIYDSWPPADWRVPIISGVRVVPPQPGEPWGGGSVAAALEVVRLLQTSDTIHRGINVTAVSVSNYGGREDRARSEIVVFAEGNCVIEWGRAPSSDSPGELPVEEKIAKFERFLSEGNPTKNRKLSLRFAGRVVVSRRNDGNGDSS